MEEVMCTDNNNWIWIILAVLLLSGSFGSSSSCGSGIAGIGGNFLDNLKCGNNSWIIILGLLFVFNKCC